MFMENTILEGVCLTILSYEYLTIILLPGFYHLRYIF